jgi:DNA-binding NtrC family response regulator
MKKNHINIFIVEDDKFFAQIVETYLNEKGFPNVHLYSSGSDCLQEMDKKPEIVILDYTLGFENGNEILKKIKEISPTTQVIMLSGQEFLHVAVKSFKYGAFDYIEKNKDSLTNLQKVLDRILSNPSLFQKWKNNISMGFSFFF